VIACPRGDSMKSGERAAYHEAGHVLVAVIKGVRIGTLGMLIDDRDHGYAGLRLRPPRASSDFPLSREASIVVLFAGLMAEKEFDYESTGKSASDDLARIDELQAEKPELMDVEILKLESGKLIKEHWIAVEHLAKAVLAKDCRPRSELNERAEDKGWSGSSMARCLPGKEIVVMLRKTLPSHNVQLEPELVID